MEHNLDNYHSMDLGSDQVSLLISLLIRFPQIGTVHYDPVGGRLRLVFLLKGVEEQMFVEFHETFHAHLETFQMFSRYPYPEMVGIEYVRTEGDVCTLEIERDLPSLSHEEINLIIQFVSGYFAESLVTEGPDVSDEDKGDQDEAIASILSSGTIDCEERLTGFREKGRVLVFSIPPRG